MDALSPSSVSILDPSSETYLDRGMAAHLGPYRTTQDALVEGLRAQVSYLQQSLEGGHELRPLSLPDLNVPKAWTDGMGMDSQSLFERERHIAVETRLQELRVGITRLLQEIGSPGGGEGEAALLQSLVKAVREMHTTNKELAEELRAARKQGEAEADKVRILEMALESKMADLNGLAAKNVELQEKHDDLQQDVEVFKERAGVGLQNRSMTMLKHKQEFKKELARGSWWPDSSDEEEDRRGSGRSRNFDKREKRHKWPLGVHWHAYDGPSMKDVQAENEKLREELQAKLDEGNADRQRVERLRASEEEELAKARAEARFLKAEMKQKEEAAAAERISQEAAVIAAAISTTAFRVTHSEELADARAADARLMSPRLSGQHSPSPRQSVGRDSRQGHEIHERFQASSPTSPRLSPRVKEEFLRRRGHSAKGAALVAHHRAEESSASPRQSGTASSPVGSTNFEGLRGGKTPSRQSSSTSLLEPQERYPPRHVRSDSLDSAKGSRHASEGQLLDELQRVQQHVRQGLGRGSRPGSPSRSPERHEGLVERHESPRDLYMQEEEEDRSRKPHLVRFYRRKCMELAQEVQSLSRRIDAP